MTGGRAVRLTIDLAMTLLVLFVLAYHMTGNTAHEWIGVAAFALFTVHSLINRRWYKTLFIGKYPWRRLLTAAVNLLLCTAMTTVLATGLLLSRTAFPFMNVADDMLVRQIHSVASYWGLLLIAVHVGMHWSGIAHAIARMTGASETSRIWVAVLRTLAVLVILGGVAASFERDMGAKLFLGASFDFWDTDRPTLLFFAANLAIIGLYVGATHYFMKGIQKCAGAIKHKTQWSSLLSRSK